MKITQKSSNKKLLIVIGVIILLAGASVGAAALLDWGPFAETKKDGSTNLDEPTKEQKEAGKSAKDQTVSNDGSTTTSGSDPTPIPAPGDENNKAVAASEITAANQNGDTLQVRTLIHLVTNQGTCTLSMKRSDGKTYSKETSVQAFSSATTCAGFDIPTSELGSGAWDITVSFENSSYKASASKQVSLQ